MPNRFKYSSSVHIVIDIPESPKVVVLDSDHEKDMGDRDELELEDEVGEPKCGSDINISSDSGTDDDVITRFTILLGIIRYLQQMYIFCSRSIVT